MSGLIWVIVIFILQAVIASLAKRAQQNAQQGGAKGSPTRIPKAPTARPSNPASTGAPSGAPSGASDPFSFDFRFDPSANTGSNSGSNSGSTSVMPGIGRDGANATRPTPPPPPRATPVVKRPTAIVTGKKSAAQKASKRAGDGAKQGQGSKRAGGGGGGGGGGAVRPPQAPPTRPMVSPARAAVMRRDEPEEADAMASRAKVAQSVAKIRSIESSVSAAHVGGLGGGNQVHRPLSTKGGVGSGQAGNAGAFSTQRIAEVLRNPQRIREAIILSEVIGPPRGMR
jgi:hypothetical protein